MSRADGVVGTALFVAALLLGTWYVPQVVAAGGKPKFYQEQFGPAVMVACGHGYVNPEKGLDAELDALLALNRDDFRCSPELAGIARLPLTSMQRAYRYLITAVGWTWRLQGHVAWSAVAPLNGLFYAATVLLLFVVFRQGMGILIAGTLAVVLALSPLHVSYLVHLRDYSKVPFVLGLVVLAARMVRSPLAFRRALLLAAGAGLLNGFAMGFRNDLLVAVPAFVALLLVFLPHDGFARGWRNLALAGTYAAAFVIALSPMLSIYRTGGGNSTQHLIMLGLGEPFNQELGLDSGGAYEWGYGYRDEFAHAMISANATRRLGATTMLVQYGPEYDRSGSDYLQQVAENFPADMLTRAYASAIRVIELPYNQRLTQEHLEYLRLPRQVFVVRDRFQRALAPLWLPIVAAALFALTVMSVRIGLFVMALTFYLSAYPALQFGERHYFHLEFVGWWLLGFVVALSSGFIRAAVGGSAEEWLDAKRPVEGWTRPIVRAAILWAVIAVVLLTPLYVLRRFQQEHLRALFEQYLAAPVEPGALNPVAQGNGYVRFEAPMSRDVMHSAVASDAVRPELFLAEFGGSSCDSVKLDAVFRYASALPQNDFSRSLTVQPPLSKKPIRVLFPAYYHRLSADTSNSAVMDYAFIGVDVPASAQACLTRFARVSDTSRLPLLLELRLPPRWESADLFETIDGIESRTNPEQTPPVYTFPADLEVGQELLKLPIEPLDATKILHRSPTLDTNNPQWTAKGVGGVGGKGPFLYLFEMQPAPLEEGRLAIVEGFIKKGGISFGLVSGVEWIAQVGVTRPGEFIVLVRVPVTGMHRLILANNLHGPSLENDVTIRRVGWLPKDHP